jgi:TctA family transporter
METKQLASTLIVFYLHNFIPYSLLGIPEMDEQRTPKRLLEMKTTGKRPTDRP